MATKISESTRVQESKIVTRLNRASSGLLGAIADRISFALRPFDTETLEKVKIFLRDHDLVEVLNTVSHDQLGTQIDYNISLFKNKESGLLVVRIESTKHDDDHWTKLRSLKVVSLNEMSQWETLKSKKGITLVHYINAMENRETK